MGRRDGFRSEVSTRRVSRAKWGLIKVIRGPHYEADATTAVPETLLEPDFTSYFLRKVS